MEQLKNLMTITPERSEFGSEKLSPKEYEQRKADAYNASTGSLHIADGYECEVCKNKGYIATVQGPEPFGYYSETLTPCKCQKARKALLRLYRSGLKNSVKSCTFDKYEAAEPWQQTIKDAARRFVADKENNWFYIGGQSGAGKTHLCTAITVDYIRKGYEARYMLWRDEISAIKADINEPKAAETIKGLKEAPVLYIDDLFKMGKDADGKVKMPTAADINIAFEIINYRYNNPDFVTIISSERTLSELLNIDEAVAGRIAEKAKVNGYCINLKKDPSRNYRMKGIEEL